jgi:hypothetical protein
VASGFRDYVDTFKAFVRAKLAQQQQEQQEQRETAAAAGGGAAGGEGGAAGGGGAATAGDAAGAPPPPSGELTITAEMVAEFNAVVQNAKRARRDGGGGLPSVAPGQHKR